MEKDLHGAWENTIDYNAPLYARKTEIGDASYLNIDWAVNYWLNNGLPKEKLVLGLATYGRVFTLMDPTKNTPGSLNNGTGSVGKVSSCYLMHLNYMK
jgi:chitinase